MNAALVAATVPVGPLVIIVSGGVRSTVHVRVAGDGSAVPTLLRTRTWNVCWASVRLLNVAGELHGRNTGESSVHSNVAPGPAFGESNVNVAVWLALAPIGPERICV